MGGNTSTRNHSNLSLSYTSTDRIEQSFLLIWLDANIETNKAHDRNVILHLRRIVNKVHRFTNCEPCVSFLCQVKQENVFLIVSNSLGKSIVPSIHSLPQLNSIYIFSQDSKDHLSWSNSWSKIKGCYKSILPLCESLKQVAQRCDENSIPISFIARAEDMNEDNLNQLDPSFMYTQILKEILLDIKYSKEYLKNFVRFCRELYHNNEHELKILQRFERDYARHSPIWWYTYDCCIYSILNRALRNQEVDIIIRMGFFIRDLHQHLKSLHQKQYRKKQRRETFLVYRGQSLSANDFDRLIRMKQGGLISFNNFLSTTRNKDVSLDFMARAIRANPNSVGILFQILIDPSIALTPFAEINQISHYKHAEEEILFSMHTIFRIAASEQMHEDRVSYWQVNLILTDDHDPHLNRLTQRIRQETEGEKGWPRLGSLLVRLGNYSLAEQIYTVLLNLTNDPLEVAQWHHQIGITKNHQEQHTQAIECYEKSLKIYQKRLSHYHPSLASCYKSLALAYSRQTNYAEALRFYHQALIIEEYILPRTHLSLASTYHDLGFIFSRMEDYPRALLFYQKTLEIYQKNLPENHPSFATCYNNIGSVYQHMNNHSQALIYYQTAVRIGQISLAKDHPDLQTYKNSLQTIRSVSAEHGWHVYSPTEQTVIKN